MRRSRPDLIFDITNVAILSLLMIIWIYPLYFVVLASFSDPYAVVTGKVFLLPVGLTVEAYQNVFQNAQIWVGYQNSLFYTIFGTAFNLFLTIPAGYALSKRYFPYRTFVTWVFLFTMFFGGGLIPHYLLVRDLGLLNTRAAMVFIGGVSAWYIVVTRTFFTSSIPFELYEAAKIDGMGEIHMFFKIALPLAAPIVAVMALYHAVGHWNSYFNALIYINSRNLEPLQIVLRKILILNEMPFFGADVSASSTQDTEYMALMARRQYMAEAMKYSLVFIASAPLLCAYPFVQKYFVKGVMIGSLKG